MTAIMATTATMGNAGDEGQQRERSNSEAELAY